MINFLRKIFFDISLLYINFIHWNISKVLIYVFSFLLWALLSSPFFILIVVVAYFDPVNWKDIIYNFLTTQSIWLSLITALSSHLFYIILQSILFVLAVGFLIFGYNYKIILLSNLYFSYLDWEKISYMKNIYFNTKKIFSYLSILSWIALVLLIPFLFFKIVFFILLFLFWWINEVSVLMQENGSSNMFSILAWIFFFISILVFLYLAYRLTFAYVIMLDKNYKENQKWIFYIKESFKITSWMKIFKFILVMIIFTILILPFDYIWKSLEELNFWSFLFWVFVFLVLNWLFEMLVISVYRNIMLDKKEEIV